MHISRAAMMFTNFLLPVLDAQKCKGHYVCVCTADEPQVEQLRQRNIDVFTQDWKRSISIWGVVKSVARVRRILIEHDIDVLVCHTPLGAGIGRLAARLAGTKRVIYFAHGLPCAPAQNPLVWFIWFSIEKVLSYFTDAILVMNSYDEELSRKHLMKKRGCIFRVPGIGVDLSEYDPEASELHRTIITDELNIDRDQKIVLCVALLKRAKGILVFIEAARRICDVRNDACFLLAGIGPEMRRIRAFCARYGLEDNFRILGWRDDVHRLMLASDVFVLPSYYFEGLPVSILEAMASAKPVVSTYHRGCEDAVVENETGFLVPIKQSVALSDKISVLLDDPTLRCDMGRAGRRRVEQCFELSYCTHKIIEAFEAAMR